MRAQKKAFMKIREKGIILVLIFLSCMLTGKEIHTLNHVSSHEMADEQILNNQRKEYIQETSDVALDKTIRHLYSNQIAYPQTMSSALSDASGGKLFTYIDREATLSIKSPLYNIQNINYMWRHHLFKRSTDYYIYGLKRLLL